MLKVDCTCKVSGCGALATVESVSAEVEPSKGWLGVYLVIGGFLLGAVFTHWRHTIDTTSELRDNSAAIDNGCVRDQSVHRRIGAAPSR